MAGRRVGGGAGAIMLATMMSLAMSSAAEARCWSESDMSAAKIRDLQSMLMVAALKCRLVGTDILTDYNGFVTSRREVIRSANDRLKAAFLADHGPAMGQREYDRMTTSMANAHGGRAVDAQRCADMAALAREASDPAATFAALTLIAEREGLAPGTPAGCPVRMAEAPPTAVPSAIAMAGPVK